VEADRPGFRRSAAADYRSLTDFDEHSLEAGGAAPPIRDLLARRSPWADPRKKARAEAPTGPRLGGG